MNLHYRHHNVTVRLQGHDRKSIGVNSSVRWYLAWSRSIIYQAVTSTVGNSVDSCCTGVDVALSRRGGNSEWKQCSAVFGELWFDGTGRSFQGSPARCSAEYRGTWPSTRGTRYGHTSYSVCIHPKINIDRRSNYKHSSHRSPFPASPWSDNTPPTRPVPNVQTSSAAISESPH